MVNGWLSRIFSIDISKDTIRTQLNPIYSRRGQLICCIWHSRWFFSSSLCLFPFFFLRQNVWTWRQWQLSVISWRERGRSNSVDYDCCCCCFSSLAVCVLHNICIQYIFTGLDAIILGCGFIACPLIFICCCCCCSYFFVQIEFYPIFIEIYKPIKSLLISFS